MKIHSRKKAYRLECKRQAEAGRINNPEGQWVARPSTGNGMIRDFYPNRK